MKYVISYKERSEPIKSDTKLYIYDFGHIKGFLYNNNFTMYKLLTKVGTEEYVELYDGIIPKNAFSIEEYDCVFHDTSYSIQGYDLIVRASLHPSLLAKEFYPQQVQQVQLPQQKKSSYIKKSNLERLKVSVQTKDLNDGGEKKQRVQHHQQVSLDSHTSLQSPSWMSLEQLMKAPSSSPCPKLHLQQLQVKQHSPPLKQKRHSSSQLRQHRPKVGKYSQNSSKINQPLQMVSPELLVQAI